MNPCVGSEDGVGCRSKGFRQTITMAAAARGRSPGRIHDRRNRFVSITRATGAWNRLLQQLALQKKEYR